MGTFRAVLQAASGCPINDAVHSSVRSALVNPLSGIYTPSTEGVKSSLISGGAGRSSWRRLVLSPGSGEASRLWSRQVLCTLQVSEAEENTQV